MTCSTLQQRYLELNKDPLNETALALLKEVAPERVNPDRGLGLLLLVQWALEENLLQGPELDAVEAQVHRLELADPEQATIYIETPEDPREAELLPSDLEAMDSPLEAAALILDSIFTTTRSRAP